MIKYRAKSSARVGDIICTNDMRLLIRVLLFVFVLAACSFTDPTNKNGTDKALEIAKRECGRCGVASIESEVDRYNKKKDEVRPAEWKIMSIFEGVGGSFAGKKKALYPNNESPPNRICRSEGHHCLAFSAFITGAKKNQKIAFQL